MNEFFFSENLEHSKGMRILIFLIILLVCSLIGVALSALFLFSGDTAERIAQGISSIMMFVAPPIVYYFITRRERPMAALGARRVNKPWPLFLLAGIAVMFVSLPVTNLLTEWNESMKLGGALQRLEDTLKAWEQTAAATTERILNTSTIGGLLLNLLVVALIPAIGEELTFRGVLQQSLTRDLKNRHIAIILSAAIFSFIHFQFYGFLPRMFLGILLGYMFYTSGSLWTSILMHFVNNATAVVVYYLNHKGVINVDVDHFGSTQNTWLIITSVVLTTGLILWSWRNKRTKNGCD